MTPLSALLLCRDKGLLRSFKLVLKDLAIEVEHCETPYKAKQLLSQRRFDAVLVECDPAQENLIFLQNFKKLPYNQRAVLLAVTQNPDEARLAREARVHFVIEGPTSVARLTPTMRAARNLMNRERRQTVRRPVQLLTNFHLNGGREFDGMILDLSHEGMAIKSHENFSKTQELHLRFLLPETEHRLEVRGTVAWADEYGRTGLRFTFIAPQSEAKLAKWLRERRQSARKVVNQFTVTLAAEGQKEIEAAILDLSEGGVAIKCDYRLEKGTLLRLRIAAAHTTDFIETEGKIAWAHETAAGISFVDMTPESERLLKLWIT